MVAFNKRSKEIKAVCVASSAQLSELELQVLDNEDTISDLWIRQLTAEACAARGVAGKGRGARGGGWGSLEPTINKHFKNKRSKRIIFKTE